MTPLDPIATFPPSDEFIGQVRHALKNLSNSRILNRHPLAVSLGYGTASESLGQHLRRELITTIESLNPNNNDHHPANAARISRIYILLKMHYVNGIKLQNIANRLGISPRQAYRDLSAACKEVSELIWLNHDPFAKNNTDNLLSELAGLKSESESTPMDINLWLGETLKAFQWMVKQRNAIPADSAGSHNVDISCLRPIVVQQFFLLFLQCAVQATHSDQKMVTALTHDGETLQLSLRYSPKYPDTASV